MTEKSIGSKTGNKKSEKKLLIIDGSSCIYRAFHAIPVFTTRGGVPTNAVYGFVQTIRKLLKDIKPDYITVAFDVKGPSFRHELFKEYKIERPPMPDDLSPQIPYIKDIVKAFNISALEKQGFEADDVMATLEKKFSTEGLKIYVVTGDKDMMQLVKPGTVIYDQAKSKEYGQGEVIEKFGVGPEKIKDFMGLSGDKSDGIPGVKGIGPKTATKLLLEFGGLDEIFTNIEQVKPDKLRAKLVEHKEIALLSRELATLHSSVDTQGISLEDLSITEPDFERLEEVLKELEFTKLIKELIPVRTEAVDVKVIKSKPELSELCANISKRKNFSIWLHREEGGKGAEGESACAVGISLDAGGGFFIPLAAINGASQDEQNDSDGASGQTSLGLEAGGVGDGGVDSVNDSELDSGLKSALKTADIFSGLKKIFENPQISKSTYDSKELYLYLSKNGIRLAGVDMDVTIAAYLLNPTRSGKTLGAVTLEYLDKRIDDENEATVSGEIKTIAEHTVRMAGCVRELSPVLKDKLKEQGQAGLFNDMELPLVPILASMESCGIEVDAESLEVLSEEMGREVTELTDIIYKAAGYSFNINSPKQLSTLLFENLGLKPGKKTKTGYSTDESVLTSLAERHPVPRDIIKYRQVSKLKSTFVDGLLGLIDPGTGRVHTSFNQTVTATGRLSSSSPNLQNIPIRGEYAARIRKAFVAGRGKKFVSADYSQIELRLVAHLSEDPVLINAFKKNEDVHTVTAAEVFDIMPGLVTKEMRRRAKAINFGIIYGMGPHGLAAELSVSMKEAKNYIEAYFERYGKVKEFIEKTIEQTRERGYTETLFSRRRYVPELHAARDQTVRFGERIAVNTPIQGTAADIIKAAMIGLDRFFSDSELSSVLLLQIHDELIVEATEDEVETVKQALITQMEGVLSLKVPIKVNVGVGNNWGEA